MKSSYVIIYALATLRHAQTAHFCCFPFVSIMGSPKCLSYIHSQGSTVFLYALYRVFFGPSSFTYSMHSSEECCLRASAVIYSHGRSISSAVAVSCSLLPSVDGDA